MAYTNLPINKLIPNTNFEGFLLVKAAALRTNKNNQKYLDLTLCDRSGEISAKKWEEAPVPAVSSIVKVRGLIQEYNNNLQLRIDKIRDAEEKDNVDMQSLVPCAPNPPEEMYAYIRSRAERIEDPQLRALVCLRLDDNLEKLQYAPAAKNLHHSERAGLLHHTSTMLKTAEALSQVYTELDADLLASGVILHDLGKITEMTYDNFGIVSDYSTEGMLVGHLVQGAAEVRIAGEKLGVRKELIWMLEHMLLSHHDLPEYGSPKPPMFPEAEVLHIIDLLDARMFEMTAALATVEPGHFTDRIWSLERRLYKRQQKRTAEAE